MRVCLLVLLAVLLSARGAMADSLVCAPPNAPAHTSVQHDKGSLASHSHDSGRRDHHAANPHEEDKLKQDTCNLCSVFCSLTPLLSAIPSVVLPQDLAYAFSPDVNAPVLSVHLDAEDRPPRRT